MLEDRPEFKYLLHQKIKQCTFFWSKYHIIVLYYFTFVQKYLFIININAFIIHNDIIVIY
jgi:hypothetical protein